MANGMAIVAIDPTNDQPYKINGRTGAKYAFRNSSLTSPQANGTLIRAGAGALIKAMGVNTNAAMRYLHIYDKATAPALGTDNPIITYPIPANAAFDLSIAGGFEVANGLGIAFSSDAVATQGLTAGEITALCVISA